MPGLLAPAVVADPIGVIVDLVLGRQPGLDRRMVTGVVEAVSGGRAKRRQLAQALWDRPAVFGDGRSPAPRAVADLLIALNKAGATEISAPVCAECGKWLRTVQRRGEHWYCGVCGPRREMCAACGQLRRVSCRDRDGRPRCSQCPPDDGRDPTPLIVDVVTQADPTLSTEVIAAAATKAAPQAGQRRRLAWALQDRPDLLTGFRCDGAGANRPATDRHALRRGSIPDHPPGLPGLRTGDSPASADRWKMVVPQLAVLSPAARTRWEGDAPRRAMHVCGSRDVVERWKDLR